MTVIMALDYQQHPFYSFRVTKIASDYSWWTTVGMI